MKTGSEIECDFYKAAQKTELAKEISGGVYRADFRPRGSLKEDMIVRFTAVSSGQRQEGVVTLLVFVPDIDVGGKGNKKRNSARLEKLEKLASLAVAEIALELDEYGAIRLQTGIQSFPDNFEQHYVSIRINFEYLNKEDYL